MDRNEAVRTALGVIDAFAPEAADDSSVELFIAELRAQGFEITARDARVIRPGDPDHPAEQVARAGQEGDQ